MPRSRITNAYIEKLRQAQRKAPGKMAEVFNIRPPSNSAESIVPLALVQTEEEPSYKVIKQFRQSFSNDTDDEIEDKIVAHLETIASFQSLGASFDLVEEKTDRVTSFLKANGFEDTLSEFEKLLQDKLPNNVIHKVVTIDDGIERLGLFVEVNESIDLDAQYDAVEEIKVEYLYNGTTFDGLPFFMQLEY